MNSLSSGFDPFIRGTLYAYATCRARTGCFAANDSFPGLILMTYEVKPNDQAASPSYGGPPLVNAGRIYYRVCTSRAALCRGKSNNFTLGELAIARFRLVCLSHIARITLAQLRTKSNMGIERRGKIRDPTFRDYRSLSSSERINRYCPQ